MRIWTARSRRSAARSANRRAKLKLWFTQRLEPAFCTVRVTDVAGQAGRQQRRQGRWRRTRRRWRVSLPRLAPGTYRVEWRVLSVDTHVSEGDFKFDVAP